MQIGVLKADEVSAPLGQQFGQYPDMLARLLQSYAPQLRFRVFDVQRLEYPEDVAELDAYLISGSRASVFEPLPWIARLTGFVRRAYQRGIPLVGICFGHQLLAQALGGRVERARQGWGCGVHCVGLRGQAAWLEDDIDAFSLLVSHQDQVLQPADGAEVLAGSDFCPIAMCHIPHRLLSLQGHPEFSRGYAEALLQLREHILPPAVYQTALGSLQQPTDERRVARWIVEFMRAAQCARQSVGDATG